MPQPEHKKSTDYVVDLFRVESGVQTRTRPRLSLEESANIEDHSNAESEDDKK